MSSRSLHCGPFPERVAAGGRSNSAVGQETVTGSCRRTIAVRYPPTGTLALLVSRLSGARSRASSAHKARAAHAAVPQPRRAPRCLFRERDHGSRVSWYVQVDAASRPRLSARSAPPGCSGSSQPAVAQRQSLAHAAGQRARRERAAAVAGAGETEQANGRGAAPSSGVPSNATRQARCARRIPSSSSGCATASTRRRPVLVLQPSLTRGYPSRANPGLERLRRRADSAWSSSTGGASAARVDGGAGERRGGGLRRAALGRLCVTPQSDETHEQRTVAQEPAHRLSLPRRRHARGAAQGREGQRRLACSPQR